MTTGDIIGLVLSYVYAFGLLLIVEAIGRRLNWPQFATRKIIHIGAGMWAWGILYFFDHWYFGIIPFATFIVLNYVFYRRQTFAQMDEEGSSPGTVYFAASITLLFLLAWRTGGAPDYVPLAMAAVMIMTWGDGLAALIGKAFGKRRYSFFGHFRTIEGSVVFLVAGFIAAFLTLYLLSASPLSPYSDGVSLAQALILAVIGTIVGAVAEGLSPAGLDNLSVPLLSGAAIALASLLIG